MRVTLAPRALRDLDAIVAFGTERWGFDAAVDYAEGLRDRLRSIGEAPHRHPLVARLRPGVRSLAYRSHRIFYLVENDAVLIVRILHQQTDSPRHLR